MNSNHLSQKTESQAFALQPIDYIRNILPPESDDLAQPSGTKAPFILGRVKSLILKGAQLGRLNSWSRPPFSVGN